MNLAAFVLVTVYLMVDSLWVGWPPIPLRVSNMFQSRP